MINILVTGKHSYIGNSFADYVKEKEEYQVDKISVRDEGWKNIDFSKYDVVLHVAGIAHIKETKENKNLYYEVNRDLTIALAQKAKKENVKQFIFLSSMSVYGVKQGTINKNTELNPDTAYGKSKKEAEDTLKNMMSDEFVVCIVRPPMIYGKGCKGNYSSLSKLAKKTPIFPCVKNQRSMLYIENLCEFICLITKNKEEGIYCPQNKEYVTTSNMVHVISKLTGRKQILLKGFSWIFCIMGKGVNVVQKIFGDLVYDYKLSDYKNNTYQKYDFIESIERTEQL